MLEIWGLGTAKHHECPQQLKSWAELCIGNVVNCSAAKQDQDPAATLHCFSRNRGISLIFPLIVYGNIIIYGIKVIGGQNVPLT